MYFIRIGGVRSTEGRRLGVKTRNKVWGRAEIIRSLEQTSDNHTAWTEKCNELNSVHLRSETTRSSTIKHRKMPGSEAEGSLSNIPGGLLRCRPQSKHVARTAVEGP